MRGCPTTVRIFTVDSEEKTADEAEGADHENFAPPVFEDKELLIEKEESQDDSQDEVAEKNMDVDKDDPQDEDFGN